MAKVSGSTKVALPFSIASAGAVAVSGAMSVPIGLSANLAGVVFPSHQKVILNFELAPTRIQYEK